MRTTAAQLKNGAVGIAYRAEQLEGVAKLNLTRDDVLSAGRAGKAINDALVEAALTNARALAWFFTLRSDVTASMYLPHWTDRVQSVAVHIVSPISRHLSHAGDGELHPGVWPIVELAVVLVGGLARFVDALDPTSTTYEVAWFTPPPANVLGELMQLDPFATPTAVSDNPMLGSLTRTVQQYLADQ